MLRRVRKFVQGHIAPKRHDTDPMATMIRVHGMREMECRVKVVGLRGFASTLTAESPTDPWTSACRQATIAH